MGTSFSVYLHLTTSRVGLMYLSVSVRQTELAAVFMHISWVMGDWVDVGHSGFLQLSEATFPQWALGRYSVKLNRSGWSWHSPQAPAWVSECVDVQGSSQGILPPAVLSKWRYRILRRKRCFIHSSRLRGSFAELIVLDLETGLFHLGNEKVGWFTWVLCP